LKVEDIFNNQQYFIDGILFSKYSNEKLEIFKKYFNFTLEDVPRGRTLIIKTINIQANENNTNIFTNSKKLNYLPTNYSGNKYSTYLPEIISWSCSIPGFFPINDHQIDGGIFTSNCLLECFLLFRDEPQKILSMKKNTQSFNQPILDGILGWFLQITKIFEINTNIINNFQKVLSKDNLYEWEIDFDDLQIDDKASVSEIISAGYKVKLDEAINFISNKINDTPKNKKKLNFR